MNFDQPKKGKTDTMVFGTAKRLGKIDKHLDVSYRGQLISNVKENICLGNTVD